MSAPRPVLVFDGDCAFCSTSARLLADHVRRSPADFAVEPWQLLDLADLGLTPEECDASVQWVGADGAHEHAEGAVGRALLASRWWARPLGALVLVPGIRQLAGVVYRWVSRNRHRLPGGTPACSA
jgi:predicted DCC family thiol-disulfide oxidoreductase YuxK